MRRNKQSDAAERGYSIVEVLVAMAILSVVLLSLVTLFYMARRNVYSGKTMTQAVAIGTHVTEDLAHMSVASLYELFAITPATTPADRTILGTTYTGAIVRSTSNTIMTNPPGDITGESDPDGTGPATGFLTSWRNEIQQNHKLDRGVVTLVIQPTQPVTPVFNTDGRPNAAIVRIRTIVSWADGTRHRNVTFDTSKIVRGN
jgi:prepilin-type N-terminal cleavage/methylation domain-containing protein